MDIQLNRSDRLFHALASGIALSFCILSYAAPPAESWAQLKAYSNRNIEASGPSTMATFHKEDKALVISVFCSETDMDKLVARTTQHDNENIYLDDSIEVFIQTEKENFFHLIANTEGAIYDKYVTPLQTLDWESGATVKVDKQSSVMAADGWKMTIRIPLLNLMGEKSVSPWRINVCRNRRVPGATTPYYTLHGWYGRPEEWLTADILNGEKIDVESLVSKSVKLPEPPQYDLKMLSGLHPSNQWIVKDKIRIFTGWPMDTFRKRGTDGTHGVYRILDRAADSGFNVVTIGPTGPIGWLPSSYTFDCASSAALHARLLGLRVIWDGLYLNQAMEAKIGTTYRAAIDRSGTAKIASGRGLNENISCPLDRQVWRDKLQDALAAQEWERINNVDISCGYLIDIEPQMGLEECYCDTCFNGFMTKKGISPEQHLPIVKRHQYLSKNDLLKEYQSYLEETLTGILRPLREEMVKASGKPGFFFMFYPGHVSGRTSWMGLALAKGLGHPEAPVIVWEDDTYYCGYAGSQKHLYANRTLLRNTLGYEPLYLPSTLFAHSISRQPKWGVERAEREWYLLNRWGPGAIAYNEHPADAVPFTSYKQAHERLKREGGFRTLGLNLPAEKERIKLESLKAVVDGRIAAYCEAHTPKPTPDAGQSADVKNQPVATDAPKP